MRVKTTQYVTITLFVIVKLLFDKMFIRSKFISSKDCYCNFIVFDWWTCRNVKKKKRKKYRSG